MPTTISKNLHTLQNNIHELWSKQLNEARRKLKKPLSLTEKILYCHRAVDSTKHIPQGLDVHVDHLALQDRQALLTIQQLQLLNVNCDHLSCSLHCDGIIEEGYEDSKQLLHRPTDYDDEMYNFLTAAATKYKMDFWPPGSGSPHQVLFYNYNIPGSFNIATDFYSSFAGGLASMGLHINSSTAIDVICGIPISLKDLNIVKVDVLGVQKKFVRAHDIVAKLHENLKTHPNNINIVEYSGPGVHLLSCLEMAKICQLGADIGIDISLFPYTLRMHSHLKTMGRSDVADASMKHVVNLTPDKDAVYDDKITLNLSETDPYICIPFIPSVDISVNKFPKVLPFSVPRKLHLGLIGRYSMATYKDLINCADIARQALSHGLKSRIPLKISPSSHNILQVMEKEGTAQILRKFGAEFPALSCDEVEIIRTAGNNDSAIITSCNREHLKEFSITPNSNIFVASPELVTIFSIIGTLDSNPLEQQLKDTKGNVFSLHDANLEGLFRSSLKRDVQIPENQKQKTNENEEQGSQRTEWINHLQPFSAPQENEYKNMLVLIKMKGCCDMDIISPSGPWLKYCGNLSKYCKNLFISAVNAENNLRNQVQSQLSGNLTSVHNAASSYKASSSPWIVVAEYGFGAGRTNEYAALQLRYMGCKAVLAKSFSSKMESDLKRHGILPLVFIKAHDYNQINSDDTFTIIGFDDIIYKRAIGFIILSHVIKTDES
ncbi:probable aconitate hydratase, mitochondrial [Schistocerca serialis cubense]|uniref:probable aconitate hydratase, mitochondrial n=1 Tax=Schistocerca serialis cubense TaxID=2023355 RepID=UPI00214E37F5|nr:probable aconitate hydratase, mitochondrial [Schistocerca serialis cubense]